MKKILLLIIFLIPFIVYAEDSCNPDSIEILSIDLIDNSKDVVEVNKASNSGNNVNVDLQVKSVGDNAKYKMIVKNTSNDDYEINKDALSIGSEYFNYSFETEDNSNIVKAGESKVVYLVVKYENEIPEEKINSNGLFVENKNLVVDLSNKDVPAIVKAIEDNPVTSTGIALLVLVLFSGIVLIVVKKTKVKKYMLLIAPVLLLIPYTVYAICKCEIKVVSKIEVNTNYSGVIYRNDYGLLRKGSRLKLHEEEIWCGINQDGNCIGYEHLKKTEEECEGAIAYASWLTTCELTKIPVGTNEYKTSSDEIDTSVYLKHEIDDGVVTKSYACYKDEENREICVQYDDDDFDIAEAARDEIYSFFEENYDGDFENRMDMCVYMNSRTANGQRMFECYRDRIDLFGEHFTERYDKYRFVQHLPDYTLNCIINEIGSYCEELVR